MFGRFVIVRSRDQGVVCGTFESAAGRAVHLKDARQIHGWSSDTNASWQKKVVTLFEMSLWGCGSARISEPVANILVLDACGVIECTPEAEANLSQSRWNQFFAPSAPSPATTSGRSSQTPSRRPA